jgi:serine/threonine protein kinase
VLPVGSQLAGYRIASVIGRGGMGVVYLAQQLVLGRRVALKVIAFELAGDPAFRERFVREAHLAASLDHPNVIPIHDAGEADGLLYIAMRYIQGFDLRTLIRLERQLDPERAAALLLPIGDALDAAHGEGLVHRDVKPANILIEEGRGSESRRAFLTDFGLTKRTDSRSQLTRTGLFVGTLDYASPEQLRGETLDGRTDEYALACVVFECLTGVSPFRRDSDAQVLAAHLVQPPPSASAHRPELPPALDAVLATALAKSRDDRFPTCVAMMEAVRDAATEAATGVPVPATREASAAQAPTAETVQTGSVVAPPPMPASPAPTMPASAAPPTVPALPERPTVPLAPATPTASVSMPQTVAERTGPPPSPPPGGRRPRRGPVLIAGALAAIVVGTVVGILASRGPSATLANSTGPTGTTSTPAPSGTTGPTTSPLPHKTIKQYIITVQALLKVSEEARQRLIPVLARRPNVTQADIHTVTGVIDARLSLLQEVLGFIPPDEAKHANDLLVMALRDSIRDDRDFRTELTYYLNGETAQAQDLDGMIMVRQDGSTHPDKERFLAAWDAILRDHPTPGVTPVITTSPF